MKTEIKSLISEINDLMAKKNAAPVEEKSSLEAKIDEMKSNLESMEKKMYRVPAGAGRSEEVKTFDQFLRTMDRKYLNTQADPDGGYLVPQEMYNQIISKIVEISEMRRLARVVTISSKSLDVDTRDADLSVYAVGEGAAVTESQPAYGRITIPAHKMMAKAIITNELLNDAAFDMVAELNERAALKFAQFEGASFITGDGVNKAQGILNAPGVANVNSGHATELTADAFWNMLANFKYRNPTFIMSRSTYIAARKLKDTIGNYLLDEGLNGQPDLRLGGIAGYIAGVPVRLMQDMPSVAAGAKAVVLGDFQEAYMIVERQGMAVVRDDLTNADEDKVRFIMKRRVGGAVVNPDALVTMTIGA